MIKSEFKKNKNNSFYEYIDMENKSFFIDDVYCESFRVKDFFCEIHSHDQLEIVLIKGGEFIFTIDSNKFLVKKGDTVLVMPNESHSLEIAGEGSIYHTVFVDMSVINSRYIDACEEKYLLPIMSGEIKVHSVISDEKLYCLVEKMIEEKNNKSDGYELAIKGYIYLFLLDIVRNHFKTKPNRNTMYLTQKEKIVKEAMQIVEQNYNEDLHPTKVAKHFGVSVQYFCNIFKEINGKTFSYFVNHMRIMESLSALGKFDKSITQVAIDYGFNDQNYFCKVFKAHMQISPTEYINKLKISKN